MKIALILRGLSKAVIKHWAIKEDLLVNYRYSLDNYKEYLFEDHDVDVFYHTYNNKYLNPKKMYRDFQPKKSVVTKPVVALKDNSVGARHTSMKTSIYNAINVFEEYVKQTGKKYDYIVITRFDLKFKKKLSSLNLKRNSFNISHKCQKDPLIDDNFIATDWKHLMIYKKLIRKSINNPKQGLHSIYKALVNRMGEKNVHFIIEGNYWVKDSPLYSIVRKKVDDILKNL